MQYDVIVIGAGLAGLTAASLLAKRGVSVAVIDKNKTPGGSCGIFKRDGAVFEQGAAMLFGFGEGGFNAHRFVFNCLEEPIDVIKHEELYCVNYEGHRIHFYEEIDRFVEELSIIFPEEKEGIKRFYQEMSKMYQHVMVESPSYETVDEADMVSGLRKMLRHPSSYLHFLSYLNQSTLELLLKYFKGKEILNFFNKLTSTYCYTNVEESPAILAAVMFIDNHVGGSFYPLGSTLFLTGKLEKMIEEHGGTMLYQQEVTKILIRENQVYGVELRTGEKRYTKNVVYSGTVWNLYEKLVNPVNIRRGRLEWAKSQIPTFPSVVLYLKVASWAIPSDTQPVEMLVGNPEKIDESEVTVYLLSLADPTLCNERSHVMEAIGPTMIDWNLIEPKEYVKLKEQEIKRLLGVLKKRFPGIDAAIELVELATPRTIERYTMKNGGVVAGPKQMLGQHLLNRLHIKGDWNGLFCCGESTTMGTGTPTVTTSGISAANMLLKQLGQKPYTYDPQQKNYVRVHKAPVTKDQLYEGVTQSEKRLMQMASRCQFCEHPCCNRMNTEKKVSIGITPGPEIDEQRVNNGGQRISMNAGAGVERQVFDIPGIMRRAAVGNWTGAKKRINMSFEGTDGKLTPNLKENQFEKLKQLEQLKQYEEQCVLNQYGEKPVEIVKVFEQLARM